MVPRPMNNDSLCSLHLTNNQIPSGLAKKMVNKTDTESAKEYPYHASWIQMLY